MASDYGTIRDANKAEYGNVGRWGRDVLVNRYDSSSHFIFEILQNAEDALKRRVGWKGSRAVRFELGAKELRIIHCGNPFTLRDVKGVCGVGETTKDLTDIGRFGIGFKSVYSITNRPEIHSGDEDFAIENFVFPVAVPQIDRASDETVFVLPLRDDDPGIHNAVAEGLSELGPRTLLFLRQVEEIAWKVEGGSSGLYLKDKADDVGDGSRRVALVGERDGKPVIDETWLVFSEEAKSDAGVVAGYIELAFLLVAEAGGKPPAIRRIDKSRLSAFFPTVVETDLGFLVQGPYRTTPSRDNVPPRDPWNIKLVADTATLLVESLHTLKQKDLLDVGALLSLPIDGTKFEEGSMFAPLFDAVLTELENEDLLPRAGGGWTSAKHARLARTQELRDLLDGGQLASLLGQNGEVHWLSGDITRDTAAPLRNYLLYQLDITELTPEQVLPRFNKAFLEAQSDQWILRMYEFLSGQPRLVQQGKTASIPLVRLENGLHVVAEADDQPQAFLPSNIQTDFPTVRRSVCSTAKSLELLKSLGLTEPDAVDDVVRNVLPKYRNDTVEADGDEYAADIKRILTAYSTQHRGQRDKLIADLKKASFIMAVDTETGEGFVSTPGDVYLATEKLKSLFADVKGVMLVDDSYSCLRGEDVRDLLEACGVSRTLCPISVPCRLTWQERSALRRAAGNESMTRDETPSDHTLRGLPELLAHMKTLAPDDRRMRASLLWDSLRDTLQRLREGAFSSSYSWTRYDRFTTQFDAEFVRILNAEEWITDAEGNPQRPEFVTFESLGWEPSPFLASKIHFKPPIIDQLAVESGIEPKVLELLKKRGLTSVAELVAALGEEEEDTATEDETGGGDVGTGTSDEPGEDDTDGDDDGADDSDITATEPVGTGAGGSGGGTSTGTGPGRTETGSTGGGSSGGTHGDGSRTPGSGAQDGPRKPGGSAEGGAGAGPQKPGRRTPGSVGGRPFISYLGTHPSEEEPDPDGLDHKKRMDLEARGIEFIRQLEPSLQPTPAGNKGYDLFEPGPDGQPTRWVEVKAMTGGLEDRPVGISIDQFECAQKHGEAFWLYVVEHAASDSPRLVKIHDPAGLARTFTFDHGWLSVAEIVVSDSLSSDKPREERQHA